MTEQEKSFDNCMDAIGGLVNYVIDETVMFKTEDNFSTYLTGGGNFRYDIATTYSYKGNRKDKERLVHLNAARDYLVDYWGAVVVNGKEEVEMKPEEVITELFWDIRKLKQKNFDSEELNEVLIKAYDLGYWEGHAEHSDGFYCD